MMRELRDMLARLADPSSVELEMWRAVGARDSRQRRVPSRTRRVVMGVATVAVVWAFMFLMGGVR